ncbi:MAG: class I SAM-dependent methyltransferase [Acidobacteria bacterium]|nr:class I SAM-dependent methyltransferase [Acidobacteriota bacterium]
MSPEEVAAAVAEIRARVRERHGKTVAEISDFELPALDPLGHARDRADGKTAAIGTVNPRPGGLVNNAIQSVKRLIARSLNWLVRDQVEFNRAAIAYMDRNIEAMAEQNYNILRVAREFAAFREQVAPLGPRLEQVEQLQADSLKNLSEWRPAFESRIETAEIRFLHGVRELEGLARNRDESYQASLRDTHQNYLAALDRAVAELQQKFWADLQKIEADHERQIHAELRTLRRKQAPIPAPAEAATPAVAAVSPAGFDYTRFEERFRGDERFVSQSLEFYLPYFENARRVLDLGCGRGELLKLLADRGVEVQGVDLDAEALAASREKGLDVVEGDLFEFLRAQPEGACGGIVCAHVVEHLPWQRVPELMELAWCALEPDGVFALETPNPACLAIFAGDFYLDPTHQKPVPAAQLDFHLREAGFGRIETIERRPAPEVYPELGKLDAIEGLAEFRKRFFGGLDYAIIARKIAV